MIRIYEVAEDELELPYHSGKDIDGGFSTSDPTTILRTIDKLAPGEYIIIQNISPATATQTEYYYRKGAC